MLAAWASALNDAGYWADMFDARWRWVFVTDELRKTYRDLGAVTMVPLGSHFFSVECMRFATAQVGDPWTSREARRAWFLAMGRYVLGSTPGGRDELRGVVDPEFSDLVDELQPRDVPVAWFDRPAWTAGGAGVTGAAMWVRLDDGHGHAAGFCAMPKPAAGMSYLAAAAAAADLEHLERMRLVERPDRRPAAILMADLEASSPLARRLSTAEYFAFARGLVRAADQCIVEAGGIVGRHAGDGVVALFLAETSGSESAAAKACISAARSLRDSFGEVAARSGIPASEVSLRFGLHWGATLYVGRILTAGRSEVTALGDEMNEAARLEACATGGRTLASKALIERLDRADADALELDARHATYTPLAELPTATDKARRDAPSIAVCEV